VNLSVYSALVKAFAEKMPLELFFLSSSRRKKERKREGGKEGGREGGREDKEREKRKREGEERGGKGKEGKVKCSEKILEERMKDSD
jgi:hypothetical protein